MKYAFHPDARLEYRDAAAYYELQRPGLAARFTIEVEAALGRVLQNPKSFGFMVGDVRRCATKVSIFHPLHAGGGFHLDPGHRAQKP